MTKKKDHKLSKLLQNTMNELKDEMNSVAKNDLYHNKKLIINEFEKYKYEDNNNSQNDIKFQEAHKFIADLLNDNGFTKVELISVLPKLKFNLGLYDILVDDYLYLDEWDENGQQINRYNVKSKDDYWIVGSLGNERE